MVRNPASAAARANFHCGTRAASAIGSSIAAATSGSRCQKSASRNVTSVRRAPTAAAISRAISSSPPSAGWEKPSVSASTGAALWSAISTRSAVESTPPDRNRPTGPAAWQ